MDWTKTGGRKQVGRKMGLPGEVYGYSTLGLQPTAHDRWIGSKYAQSLRTDLVNCDFGRVAVRHHLPTGPT